jgi:hypothetical protein
MNKTRLSICVFFIVHCSLFIVQCSDQAFAQHIQRRYSRKLSVDVPFYSLIRVLPESSTRNKAADKSQPPFQYAKIRFAPIKILGRFLKAPEVLKEFPRISPTFNRSKLLPKEPVKKAHTGIVVELESAYGIYDTLIGRLQHGTQFKGAHYSMRGHWEKTDGERRNNKEENIAASVKVDWDISKSSTLSLGSSYFQSNIGLPQLQDARKHKKSTLQIGAGLQTNFETHTNLAFMLSGEHASFSDQDDVTFEMNSYGGQLMIKQLWGEKNTLSFHSTGYWDEYDQDEKHFDDRYYGTSVLMNSYVMPDKFAVDTGVQFDYYHSEDLHDTEYLIAPIVTTRFQLFRNTTLYATYHPRLKFPRFTDLYIRKLYTTVNPELRPEKDRHYVESGISQRFGEALSLNIGCFYRESDDILFQIDENHDNILEYEQLGSASFMGIKTNLQMNYREQFVQSITYTYTNYNIFSGQDTDSARANLHGNILTYQPNHQVQASIYWVTPFGLAIDLNGTYISEQFRDRHGEQNRIGKRFFINVELTQKISDNFQVFLLGRNLTDTNTYDIIPILDSEEITSSRLVIGGVRFRF